MRTALLLPLFGCTLLCHSQAFEWTQLEPFPGSARDDAAAFTIGNTVFVGTGRAVDFSLTNDWYAFDMVAGSWTAIAALPSSGRQYCATFTVGGHGYLFGGIDDGGPLNELWRYDPLLDQWQSMAPLPAAGRYASVAFDHGLVCTGLLEGGVATNESWQYDVDVNNWSGRSPVPGPARHRASGSGPYGVVAGGADEAGNALSDVHVHDPGTDTWITAPELPAARYGADATYNWLVDEYLFIGGASSPSVFHDDVWTLSGTSWQTLPPFSGGPRRGGVVAFGTPLSQTMQHTYYGTGTDGTQRYSDWWMYVNLTENVSERTLRLARVFPNPSIGLVRFDAGTANQVLHYVITDMAGRTVSKGSYTPSATLDLTHLPAGLYTVMFIGIDTAARSSLSIIH